MVFRSLHVCGRYIVHVCDRLATSVEIASKIFNICAEAEPGGRAGAPQNLPHEV